MSFTSFTMGNRRDISQLAVFMNLAENELERMALPIR